jgi:tRNA pseudouridine13 synthase
MIPNIKDHEKFVGIESYTTNTPPFGGKIKTSISDFIVREIQNSGAILTTRKNSAIPTPFSKNRDKWTTFTLIKKKTDTILAIRELSHYLGIPSRNIKYAGIKDNTAITSQAVSIRGNYFHQLKNFKHKNIEISDIRPTKKGLELGSLWGNNFNINIRDLKKPYEEIKDDVASWVQQIEQFGFLNYYGMQRFGQHRPNSHLSGKHFLLGEYQKACEEFLFTVYPREYESIAEFRTEASKSKDYRWASENCPRSLAYEKMILDNLASQPELNFLKGFQALPHTLINLILSSYQSFLFNKVVSMRIRQGIPIHQPVKGDLICILKEKNGNSSLVFYKYGGWNDDSILKSFKHQRAAIICPILGYKTKIEDYPFFEPIIKKLLEEEQFNLESFKHNIPNLFSFEGTFRTINKRPSNLKVDIAHVTNKFPEIDPKGVKLEFSLPKGTYATLLLREFVKRWKNA